MGLYQSNQGQINIIKSTQMTGLFFPPQLTFSLRYASLPSSISLYNFPLKLDCLIPGTKIWGNQHLTLMKIKGRVNANLLINIVSVCPRYLQYTLENVIEDYYAFNTSSSKELWVKLILSPFYPQTPLLGSLGFRIVKGPV